MRVWKLFLISLLVFFVLLTAVGSLFPSRVQISRAIDLPGSSATFIVGKLADPSVLVCWNDTAPDIQKISVLTDSSLSWEQGKGVRVSWVVHETAGRITLQGLVQTDLGWLPWQRFRSLLMEPRYGPWLERKLESFKGCLFRSS